MSRHLALVYRGVKLDAHAISAGILIVRHAVTVHVGGICRAFLTVNVVSPRVVDDALPVIVVSIGSCRCNVVAVDVVT